MAARKQVFVSTQKHELEVKSREMEALVWIPQMLFILFSSTSARLSGKRDAVLEPVRTGGSLR